MPGPPITARPAPPPVRLDDHPGGSPAGFPSIQPARCHVSIDMTTECPQADAAARIALDHLVYAVPDLDLGIRAIERRMGVRPEPGGAHAGLGTRNAIVSLGRQSYLEIIAPDPEQPDPLGGRLFDIDEATPPRLLTWARKSAALPADVAAARARGIDLGRIVAMSRRQPNGRELCWTLTVGGLVEGGIVPFLIDWNAAPHPAADAPEQARLVRLRAKSPMPGDTKTALDALRIPLDVEHGAEFRLIATLDSPKGRVDLS